MMKLEMGGGDELSWLQFVVDMTKALAWPLTVIFVAWVFRRSLGKLAGELQAFEGLGVKIDFKKGAQVLSESVGRTKPPPSANDPKRPPVSETNPGPDPLGPEGIGSKILAWLDLEVAAAQARRMSVISAWAGIEAALREIISRAGIELHGRVTPPAKLIRIARGADLISAETVDFLQQAQILRNAVAHGEDTGLTAESAEDYVRSASDLAARILTEGYARP